MRLIVMTLTALSCCLAAEAAQQAARSMSGQFSVTSREGWAGRRYIDGGVVFAEEFDANNDGVIDVWRFYRRGLLSSEEQDLNADGKVDLASRWDPKEPGRQNLIGLSRDTRFRGANDLEIDFDGRRWTINVDRNGDGIADRILIAEGPREFFEQLALNLDSHPDVIEYVPIGFWIEYRSDDQCLGFIADYRRYARGVQTQWGEWNGRRVVWRRMNERRQPPPAAAVPAASAPAPAQAEAATWTADSQTAFAPPPAPAASGVGDVYSDPYAAPDPFAAQAGSGVFYYGDGAFVDTTPPPAFSDRTRYEGLPPGESAARSLPARMRPPGEGRRQ